MAEFRDTAPLIIVVSVSAAHRSLHQQEQGGSSSDVRLIGYTSSYRCSVRFADQRENLGGWLIIANQTLHDNVSIYVNVNFRPINKVEVNYRDFNVYYFGLKFLIHF